MRQPQEPGSIASPRLLTPYFSCYECGDHFTIESRIVDSYMLGSPAVCPKCGMKLDWWELAIRMVRQNFANTDAFQMLGAKQTLFRTKIFLHSRTRFNLYKEGLPNNALILDLGLIPEKMPCTELSGNTRRQRNKGGELEILAFQPDSNIGQEVVDEADLNITVTWIENSADDAAWNSLIMAFDYYSDKNYEASLLPANVAVETRLFRFLEHYLWSVASKKRVKDFLDSNATYSHQLNILLPLVASHLRAPSLASDLRGRLNRLRDLRNQVAHNGRCDHQLSKDECAELITAALFGFRYFGHFDWQRNS